MMTSRGLTPGERVDRELGKAINYSSQGDACAARECLENAYEAMPDLPENVWSHMQVAQTYGATEELFRYSLREARQFLEGEVGL